MPAVDPFPGLKPPPRELPVSLVIDELFGGPLACVGWIIFGVTMLAVPVFVLHADLSGWRYRGAVARAQAVVTSCSDTGYSEGGGRGRAGTPIYRHDFVFDDSGVRRSGASYVTGGGCDASGRLSAVEFPAGQPERARLIGMRAGLLPWTTVFVLLFPLLGLALVLQTLLSGLRDLRVMRRGSPARGRLVESKPTGTKLNNRPVYAMRFSYTDRDGVERAMTTKTIYPERLQAAGEPLLYDPERPEDAVAVDALPQPLFATPSGELASDGWERSLRRLIAPALAVLANGYWLLRLLVR